MLLACSSYFLASDCGSLRTAAFGSPQQASWVGVADDCVSSCPAWTTSLLFGLAASCIAPPLLTKCRPCALIRSSPSNTYTRRRQAGRGAVAMAIDRRRRPGLVRLLAAGLLLGGGVEGTYLGSMRLGIHPSLHRFYRSPLELFLLALSCSEGLSTCHTPNGLQ